MPAPKDSLRGTTQGRIDPAFQARLNALKARALANAQASSGSGTRLWDLPPELVTDLLDIANLHVPAHDRTNLNTNYSTVTAAAGKAGTTGDMIALLHQIDFMAAEERALRLRHSSVIRSFAHAAGRRFGLGQGTSFDRMREQIERMIQAGGGASG